MAFSAEVMKRVANITRNALYEKFPEGFVFEPIVVENKVDYWHQGEEYLEISIIYDGDYHKLDPGWSLFRRIEPDLLAIGVDGIPSYLFCEKSEWEAGPPK